MALHTFASTRKFKMVIVTHKVISLKKKSVWRKPLNILLMLLAVPVIIIAGISLLLFYLVSWVGKQVFKPRVVATEKYYLRLEFIQHPGIGIWLVEDEDDQELAQLNELWADEVYAQETSLFRIQTIPVLTALEGKLCCHFLKEMPGGSIMQLLPQLTNDHPLETALVYLDHQSHRITEVDQTGPFHLYNDEQTEYIIRGFNNENNIEITVSNS